MASELKLSIGTVREVENTYSEDAYDGQRVRAELFTDKTTKVSDIPWAFPLLPKSVQVIPKVGEAVFVINDGTQKSQRYYIGPIISQPQYNTYCKKDDATSLLDGHLTLPIERISNVADTWGSFPNTEDIAMVGRGAEDVTLKFDENTKASEVDLRAGIRMEPTNDTNPNMRGNVIFNGTDPAYIQIKYKKGLVTGEGKEANSVVNVVACLWKN